MVVAHGALGDCSVLAKQGVLVTRLFDTQIAHACLEGGAISSGNKQISYAKIVKRYLQEDVALQGSSQSPKIKHVMRTPHEIMKRPLPDSSHFKMIHSIKQSKRLINRARNIDITSIINRYDIFWCLQLHFLYRCSILSLLYETVFAICFSLSNLSVFIWASLLYRSATFIFIARCALDSPKINSLP